MGKIVITKKGLKSFLLAGSVIVGISTVGAKTLSERVEYKTGNTRELEIEVDEKKTLSDIYQDSMNLELSKEAMQAINEICKMGDDTGVYIDLLGINLESTTEAYAHYANIEVKKHKATKLYDAQKDDINWDEFVSICYKNSRRTTAFINPNYESLTKEEIEEKAQILKETLEKVKEDFPDYDVATLACNLESCSINYNNQTKKGSIAQNTGTGIQYFKENYNKLDTTVKKQTDIHEDIHFIAEGCKDIKEKTNLSRGNTGINISLDTSYFDCNNSFYYTFLAEIYTELYSCELAGIEQNSYMNYDEILSTLQLTLGLDDDYQIDSILANMLYKDPISFIQNFKAYGEEKDAYFVKNCQMLKAYDVLLAKNDWYQIKLEREKLKESFAEEGIYELQQLALNQMTRNFFNNLIAVNEEYQNRLSLEDNFYLIDLFSEYLLRSSISMIESAKDEYGTQGNNMCYLGDTILTSCKDTMFEYLGIKYGIDMDSIKEQQAPGVHNSATIKKEAPPVFQPEKRKYYDSLSATRYDYNQPYVIPLQKQKSIIK